MLDVTTSLPSGLNEAEVSVLVPTGPGPPRRFSCPDPGCSVFTSGDKELPSGLNETSNRPRVPMQHMQELSSTDVPQAGVPIVGARRDELAIGAERDGPDWPISRRTHNCRLVRTSQILAV
jgi:hypothetical protein